LRCTCIPYRWRLSFYLHAVVKLAGALLLPLPFAQIQEMYCGIG